IQASMPTQFLNRTLAQGRAESLRGRPEPSDHESQLVHRPQAVLAQQFHELRQSPLFVGPEVVVDMPAQIILAEIVIVFRAAADDGIERVEAETLRFAQLPAQ